LFPPLLVAFVVAILLGGAENVIAKNGYPRAVNYNINDVNKTNQGTQQPWYVPAWYPKKEIRLVLPYLGLQSKIITKQLKAFILNKFYGCIDLWAIFQNTHCIKSLFPYKDRLNRSQMSKVVYKASCWDCQDFYIGKTKRKLYDRKTERFKAITSNGHRSEHVTSTGHNTKWDHFDILAGGKSDTHCKIKETPLIRDLKPALDENTSSEKLQLLILVCIISCKFSHLSHLFVFNFSFTLISYISYFFFFFYVNLVTVHVNGDF